MSSYIEYIHARPHDDDIVLGLSKALNFTTEDLVANRAGRLSKAQQQRYLQDKLLIPLAMLAGGIAFSWILRLIWAGTVEHRPILTFLGKALGALLTLHFGEFADLYFKTGDQRLPIIVLAFLLGAPVLSYKKVRAIPIPVIKDVLANRVSVEQGIVETLSEEPKSTSGDRVELDYYLINGRKLQVNSAGKEALVHGYQYKVYYLPSQNTLLSIENIPPA